MKTNYLGTVYFTTEKLLKEQPQLVAGFARAVIKGWEFVYQHEDEAVALMGQYDPSTLTPDMIRFTLARQRPQILPSGASYCTFTDEMWRSTVAVLKRQHLLDESFSVEGAYISSFLTR